VLSFLSPCVLPLVPPYLCFLAGVSLNELTESGPLQRGQSRRIVLIAGSEATAMHGAILLAARHQDDFYRYQE
jgi:cytochrome c biogenesis protein CcdA